MLPQNSTRTRWIAIVLVTCAALQSIVYFGHQAVPNPDFTAFKFAADRVLAGEIPVGEKRTPVLGLIHHALALLVPGPYRHLSAGWLLNAILHPLTALLFFTLARKRIGDVFAGFLGLAVFSNPQILRALVQPLAETPLLFLAIAFFWALDRRSKATWWIAGLASVIRYDSAALIGVACAFALLDASNLRERLLALGKSALAVLPAAAWLLVITLTWPDEHYGENYLHDVQAGKFLRNLGALFEVSWRCIADPYWSWAPTVRGHWWPAAQLTFVAACVLLLGLGAWRALRTRDRTILGTLLYAVAFAGFLLSYWIIPRYCGSLGWVGLLVAACGLHELAHREPRASAWPGAVRWMVLLGAAAWSAVLVRRWGGQAQQFPESFTALWLTGAALLAMTVIAAFPRPFDALPGKSWLLPGAAVLSSMLLSNYRSVSYEVADGRYEHELRELASWLAQNAKPGDIVYTPSPELLHYFLGPDLLTLTNVRDGQGGTALEFFDFCVGKRAAYICVYKRERALGSPASPFELEFAGIECPFAPYWLVQVFENPMHGTELWIFGKR